MYSDPSKKLGVMSIGFLLENRDDAVVWRGPKKNGIIINTMELQYSRHPWDMTKYPGYPHFNLHY